ncbi:MAG: alpha/beta fold hydrolase [Negativicutes bacterium]|nr:alpha/beta fold hydrolase [Negativicutes bacterium]
MKVHEWIPSRGKRLSAMLHTPAQPGVRTPVVICCHGFTGDKVGSNQLMLTLAKRIEAVGFVVRFDFAGSGESEGEFAADTTVKGWQEDLRCVVDWVKARPEMGDSPLYLLGHSLGGLVALTYSGRPLAGRIALAPVVRPVANCRDIILGAELWEQARNGATIANFYGKGFSLDPGFVRDLLTGNYDPLAAAGGCSEPLLLIHGDSDVAVPLEGSKELYSRYAGPKEMQIMTATDHVFVGRHADLAGRIVSWLTR